jgi:YVTN family beta-propeller protein
MAVVNNHNELWLIGEYSTEIWYDAGSGTPPFARMSGGIIDYGTYAPYSVARGSNTLFWLVNQRNGDTGTFIGVGMANGYGMEIISPTAINYQISKYSVVSDAIGYCYADKGHEFYVLTFPTENATWVYDNTTKLWHERSYYSGSPYVIGRHHGSCYTYAWGKHFIGSYNDGKIYEMSENYLDDDGTPIASIRTFFPMDDKDNGNRVFVSKLQIEAEMGVGVTNGFVPVSPTYITKYSVGSLPQGIDYDGSYLWVANSAGGLSAGTVNKINIDTGEILNTVEVGTQPIGLLYAFGYIWVANTLSNTISKIDPATATVIATYNVGYYPNFIASDGSYLWITLHSVNQVVKVNPNTGAIVATVYVGTYPEGLVYALGYIWVANNMSNSVTKIDVNTDSVDTTIPTDYQPGKICFDGSYIWVTNFIDNSIQRIDPTTNTADIIYPVGVDPEGIIFDRNYLWVANYNSSNLSRVSPSDGTVLNVAVPGKPILLYFDGKNIWATLTIGNAVAKIQIFIDAPGTDPKALLSWSTDGGHTWSNDHAASMGKTGEYNTRMVWRRLGCARNRTFRLAISDPVKKVITGGYIESERGMN